jgi:hypothetical protein
LLWILAIVTNERAAHRQTPAQPFALAQVQTPLKLSCVSEASAMTLPQELQSFLDNPSLHVDSSAIVRCIVSYLDALDPSSVEEFVASDNHRLIKSLALAVVRAPGSEGSQQFMQAIGAIACLAGGSGWQGVPLDFLSTCVDILLQEDASESILQLSASCIVHVIRFCCSERASPGFCADVLKLMEPLLSELMSKLDSDSEFVVSSSLSILFALHRTSLATQFRAAVRSHPNITFLCSSSIKALNRADSSIEIEEICNFACAFLSAADTAEFFYPADLEIFMQILVRELGLCLADQRESSDSANTALTLLVALEVTLRTPWHKSCKFLLDDAFKTIKSCCLSPHEEVSFVAHQIIGSHF